jgi:hypothetical protein
MARILVFVAAAALLALPGSALAAYTPALTVTSAGPTTTIALRLPPSDDATAKVIVYTPPGSTATVTHAPWARIGTVAARVLATDFRGADIPFAGAVAAGDPARYAADPASVACAGAAQHDAVWVLNLTAVGQTIAVPVYVDVAEGPEAAFAGLKLQLCLTAPQAPLAQGGNVFGARPYDLSFTVGGLGAAGTWLGLFAPFSADGSGPDAARAVESRSTVRSAARLTTVVRRVGRAVRVTGAVTAGGAPVAGVRVQLVGGPRRTSTAVLGTVRTGAGGTFSFVTRRAGVAYVRATAVAATRASACTGPSPLAPAPCASATLAGFTVRGSAVRVR